MGLQDKTEAASPRKREEAREEGRVAKSNDLVSAAVLLFSLLIVRAAGPFIFNGMSSLFKDSLSNLHKTNLTVESLPGMAAGLTMRFAMLSAPILIGCIAIGVVANVLQVGYKVTPKVLKPDMNKLNPVSGMAKLVSKRSMIELVKSLAKIAIVAYCAYSFLRSEYPGFIDLAGMSISDMLTTVVGLSWKLMARGCLCMLIIGILDYIYQKFEFENSIKMSKQEVKEEFKRTEGDPQIKGKIRSKQRALARQRLSTEVARADVIITNPTHFAVAIKYDSNEMSAPIVVAKGQRLMALKIREIAKANGIPIVENPPVARLIYRTVEIGQQIPEALYQTVAEILAYVYQLGKKAGGKKLSA